MSWMTRTTGFVDYKGRAEEIVRGLNWPVKIEDCLGNARDRVLSLDDVRGAGP